MEVTKSRFRLAALVTAVVLGVLGLALIAAWVLLTYLTRDLRASKNGLAPAFGLACVLLGVLVARRQPRNPEGWLLLGLGVVVITVFDSGLYAVLDYRMHRGQLPLGEPAVFLQGTLGRPLFFLFPLVILFFPDGRLTRRWAWVLRSYLLVVVVLMAGIVANEVGTLAGRHIQVDLTGAYSGPGSPTGVLAGLAAIAGTGWILALAFRPAFAARQVLSWRRAADERRQQLKWLMGGAALALAGLAVIALGPAQVEAAGIPALALAALPVSMSVGILKYHLYDIDRIISRTLAYALVTGLLVGLYRGWCCWPRRCSGSTARWRSPPPPWRSPRYSTRSAARSSAPPTAGSTAPGTTPRRPWRCSPRGLKTPLTWSRSETTWPASCSRPWNRPAYRCGSARLTEEARSASIQPFLRSRPATSPDTTCGPGPAQPRAGRPARDHAHAPALAPPWQDARDCTTRVSADHKCRCSIKRQCHVGKDRAHAGSEPSFVRGSAWASPGCRRQRARGAWEFVISAPSDAKGDSRTALNRRARGTLRTRLGVPPWALGAALGGIALACPGGVDDRRACGLTFYRLASGSGAGLAVWARQWWRGFCRL
jgi:hypothetical protein